MAGNISKTSALQIIIIFSFITAALSVTFKEHEEKYVYQNVRYEWTIENLRFSDFIQNESLNSSIFSEWYLSLYPNGYLDAYKDYISIFVHSTTGNVSANVRYGLKNARNEEINIEKFDHYFSPEGLGWGFADFALRDFVINEQNGLFVNNSLTVFCEIKTNISRSQDLSEKVEQLLETMKGDLETDLAVLLDNELLSDVTISSSGKNFSTHKVILTARCPFFKALFEQDTLVRNTSRINMTDVDDEVMREMLRYIYTGKISNLEDLAQNLLPETERCEWVHLKALCEYSMSSKLSIENAVEYYELGDAYFAESLKNNAKDFIVAHATDIVSTTEFKSLIVTHPLLVEEIFSSLIKKLPTN